MLIRHFTKRLYLLLLSICLLPFSTTKAQSNWNEGPVHIRGYINPREVKKDNHSISFIFTDLFGLTIKKLAQINKDGSFEIEHRIIGLQDITVQYDHSEKILAIPNDSIVIVLNNKPPITIKNSKLKTENTLLPLLLLELAKMENASKDQQAIKDLLPEPYKKYIEERKIKKNQQLNSFRRTHPCPHILLNWANDYINYEALSLLMRYRWEHPMANNIPRNSFQLPESYFSFLNASTFDFPETISTPHASFLHEWYRHIRDDIPKDSTEKLAQLRKEGNYLDFINMQVRYIRNGSKDFIRDLFLTKYFYNILQGNTSIEFEQTYSNDLIHLKYFQDLLQAKHEEVIAFLATPQKSLDANFRELKINTVKEITDSLFSPYSGKVIYIDFWAPWCAPCLTEMPFMKQIQDAYINKDIVFLFLANRCSSLTWKATIAKHQIKGDHVLLSNDAFNQLSALYQISGIPHYVIIDKKGRLVSGNAPAPSNKESLNRVLNTLLQ